MAKSIVLSSIIKESEVIEFSWLLGVLSNREMNIALPSGVSLGLLGVNPFLISSWDGGSSSCRLTDRCQSITSNSRWIFKTNIVAMNFKTTSTSWIFSVDMSFIFVHGWWNIIMSMIINVSTQSNFSFWDWSTEVSSSLSVSFLVGSLDKTVVVHDWMPKGKFHITDQLENSIILFCGNPFSLMGKESTVTHA